MAEGEGEEVLTPGTRLAYTLISVLLVLTAGLMSGLTLGLMSLDTVELEVLKRSGKCLWHAAAMRALLSANLPRWFTAHAL